MWSQIVAHHFTGQEPGQEGGPECGPGLHLMSSPSGKTCLPDKTSLSSLSPGKIQQQPSPPASVWHLMCCFFLDCPAGRWGPDCQSSCEPCANGGQCNRETGACDCPPGYTGASCSASKSSHLASPRKESQFETLPYGLIFTFLLFCEMPVALDTLIQDKVPFSFRNSPGWIRHYLMEGDYR